MAEACRIRKFNADTKPDSQEENFCVFNVMCVFISLVTILADLTTDIIVFAEYCKDDHLFWALATIIFIVTPNVLINIFSIRWFIIDQKVNASHWATHVCLVGLLQRYVTFLRKVFLCKNLETIKTNKFVSQRNDLSLLHFLYIFTGTVPQIILHIYAIISLNENNQTKVFALTASIASVIWGSLTYIYSITAFNNEAFEWSSLLIKLSWHFGMLIARVSGILLFTIVFGIWTLLPLGVHWSAMTFWIVIQKTTFCPNKFEETLYNVVMGFVYCFCYINLREGHTRYRLMLFYTLIISQNFGSLLLYVLISETEKQKQGWSIGATICVIIGTIIGLCCMISYYKYFHIRGPIEWKHSTNDIELNNKTVIQHSNTKNEDDKLTHIRSFKSVTRNKNNETGEEKSEVHDKRLTENADKKFLLDHWIARSGTPTFISAPISNNSMDVSSVDICTIENTPQSMTIQDKENSISLPNINIKFNKKRIICSPTELTLKLSSVENMENSIDEITSKQINLHKRRGICSSDELSDNLTNLNLDICNIVHEDYIKTMKTDHSSVISHDTDGSNKKTSSDSIDMDLDLSFSDINSSDINTFNENIVQKLCLSALKNIKVGNQDADIENIQRIALDILKEMYSRKNKNGCNKPMLSSKSRDLDTPTEVLSVHDYENICAVNIAREAWGLRSWNGYCDIENWLHDGSVVRDRSRDTFTSGSSEISSCLSQELKNAILSAPPFLKKAHTYSNVFVKFDRTNQEDYANTLVCNDDTFLAKPCLIENIKDPNHLEPILEELDDLGDIDPAIKKRLNSESSLVATIDEIRKSKDINSPRNLYHRREQIWDSPQLNKLENVSNKLDSNLSKALWKEPSKFNSSNIMEPLPEKESIMNISHQTKFEPNRKEINFSESSSFDFAHIDDTQTYNKNTKRRQKSHPSNLKAQCKKSNTKPDHNLQDLSNKNIDYLWQLVSENSRPHEPSADEFNTSRMSTSLQSLIQDDKQTSQANVTGIKLTNIKKSVRTRPRRKFSILRERFEPKLNLNSDEENLCYSSENILRPWDANNIKNKFDATKTESAQIDFTESTENILASIPTVSKNVKDRRSLFMKQVLTPPKFNTKLKHKV